MGTFSISHWLIVALVVLVLFGRGRISETMAELGSGIRSFRKGMSGNDQPPALLTANEPVPLPHGEQPSPATTTATPIANLARPEAGSDASQGGA